MENTPRLKPWEGAKLKALKEEDLPRKKPVIVYLPLVKYTEEELLKIIHNQNPNLKANTWRVFKREDNPKGTQIVVGVEKEQLKALSEQGTIYFGVREAYFRLLGGAKKPDATREEVNLHHAKGASALIAKRFTNENIDIGLLQEPWNIRECVSQDLVAVVTEVPVNTGRRSLVFASAYFPGDQEEVPPRKIEVLINYCKRHNYEYIIGCDANAHNTVWGSTDTNKRGNKPTFMTRNRQEVLDLTLAKPCIKDSVKDWHVSQEISLSDHQQIRFNVEIGRRNIQSIRVPRPTNWKLYEELLTSELGIEPYPIETIESLERAATEVLNAIHSSYEESCPIMKRETKRDVPWWNKTLENLKRRARKLFNRAKGQGRWEEYRQALTEYNKEIRKSKRRSWRKFCEGIEDSSSAARIHKVLQKDRDNGPVSICRSDKTYTENQEETLKELLKTHFPQCTFVNEEVESRRERKYPRANTTLC
nr:uncharacterized protein LOC112211654 [Halyomorpha halys]